MVSFPIVAFVVVKLKILNVFVLIQHHRVFLPLIQSTPTPLQKKKKRKLSDFTKNFPKCRMKIKKNSVLRIFENFKFLQKQDVYTQTLYFWFVFETPVSLYLNMAEFENNYFQR